MNSKYDTEMNVQTISAAQLREMVYWVLFQAPNKEMTVWELWNKLCDAPEPNKEVEVDRTIFVKLGLK